MDSHPKSGALPGGHPAFHNPRWFPALVLTTLSVVLFLRLVQIDRLPGELYGDIAIVYDYIHNIRSGRWPANFVLSAGPLYHYAVTPVVWVTGLHYLGLKLASVVVSLGVLGAIYALARDLLDRELALLSVFIGGVSSWLLVFSRLGNSQILVPLLTTLALAFAVRVGRRGRTADVLACAVVSALGLYTYPQTFVLPPVMLGILLCLRWTRTAVRWDHLLLFVAATLFFALPFMMIVAGDPANFFSGYIGGKLSANAGIPKLLARNLARSLLALHVRGDVVFRSNPVARPHLDLLSGVLFLFGVLFWLSPGRRRWSPALLVPFVLLQAPSILVLSNPAEVPSASRTLGIAPIAYILVASGLRWAYDRVRGRGWTVRLALAGVLALILVLNSHRYFVLYAEGLPNHNTPFGRIIAEYLDGLPPKTAVYLAGCCWGQAGQPEPKGIRYAVKRPRELREVKPGDLTCTWLRSVRRPAVLLWSPRLALPAPGLARCAEMLRPELHTSPLGEPVFHSSNLRPPADTTPVGGSAASTERR